MSNDFGAEDAVVIGKFSRDGSGWSFTAIGQGHVGGLGKLVSIYANRF